MKQIHQKYHVGVVKRGVVSEPARQTSEILQVLLDAGKNEPGWSLKHLKSSAEGLAAREAARRIAIHGKNEVAHEKPPAWWLQLIRTFFNPFIAILFVLGATSLFTDVLWVQPGDRDWTKIVLLAIMVSISALLRFWQEFRSQKAAEKLRALVQNHALVARKDWPHSGSMKATAEHPDGNRREIPVGEIVPGDIVYLSSGDMVPADLRLIGSEDLFVSQSALTGESMPIEKFATPINAAETKEVENDRSTRNPADLNTLCFMGTNVVSGSGMGVVVSTGDRTYFGSMARRITGQRSFTNFDKGISRVSWLLIRLILVMVPVVFLLNGFTKNDWKESFFFALAVAVGMTPEMLPMVVTANLAKGAIFMARRKVIIKKLNAIQNFGAMDVFCTDKTGTLTENRIVMVRHLDTEGKESLRVLDLAYSNSNFQTGLKNLMDQAILEHKEANFPSKEDKEYHKIDEIPFDFARRRMSVVVQKDGGDHVLICKGAVEEILNLCSHVEQDGKVTPISGRIRSQVAEFTKTMNSDGLRAIAVAYKHGTEKKHHYSVLDEQGLILAGYVGFLDPPKTSAKEAIELLEQHGIRIKIITGDNEIVTARICKDVGLKAGKMLLGSAIESMSDAELEAEVGPVTIFAKIDPLQKARIIEALRAGGHTVGFMGDGVNDAAAMREADVGISVDTGVDIAKEAADIILLEHDLLVLDRGVMEGRAVFGNIMKYIKMTASSNFGNAFSLLIASAFLPFLPMLPIQLLVQNLLYDISQLSIPLDNMDKEFLRKPHKWEASGIVRFMAHIGPLSSVFDVTTFLMMWFVFKANAPEFQALFQSGWFVEGLLSQTLIVHLIRTQKVPFIGSRAAWPVLALTSLVMVIGITLPFTVFGRSIGLVALPMLYFPLLAVTLLGYWALTQTVKKWYLHKFSAWL